jgi:hypothetical protein
MYQPIAEADQRVLETVLDFFLYRTELMHRLK